jgi:hypothetical protein
MRETTSPLASLETLLAGLLQVASSTSILRERSKHTSTPEITARKWTGQAIWISCHSNSPILP